MSFSSAARRAASNNWICAIRWFWAPPWPWCSVIVGGAFSIGVSLGAHHRGANPIDQLGSWSAELLHQQAQIEDVRRVLQEKVNALAMRVGQMNANVIRLDALGKRLTRMANLDDGEFDFGNPPAQGGGRGRGRPAGADSESHGHGR